jgi:hypothetical protein
MLRLSLEFLALSIVAGFSYFYIVKKQHRIGQLKGMYAFFIIWLSWTILCLLSGLPLVPRPSNIPPPNPSPQIVFHVYLFFVMSPALIVLWLIVLDITITIFKKGNAK